ncbi:tetratricopeptide repeat protein [Rhizobium alvei]|uniref:Tetratricopeptide repeat protein n=1 Tax=Rhizobium alvei TaxID=1132659 RepID=A0ABT8YS75_9HYPH|nr:tetratricopeptide repeat protein [Rhizobium alvei]MDO6966218.1 tetratricopeptide repeat protein [Rhizobium alvei]
MVRFGSSPVVSTIGKASVILVLALALGACSSVSREKTASIPRLGKPVEMMNAGELSAAARRIGEDYARNPKDRQAGLNYATLLRMTGKNEQALAVMRQMAILYPQDREVLASYGKSLAGAGELEQALATIARAQTPDRPDWKLKSAEGAILDQLGRPEEARAAYRDALDANPNEPSVLSNLGMSYLLTRDLKSAETYLRTAISQPGADSRIRQNLALVVGLQGRFQEAENIARQELTAQQAEANIAYLKGMLAQENSWKKLANEDNNTN